MDKAGVGFKYVRQQFLISDAIAKEGIFVGPQVIKPSSLERQKL